MTLPQTFSWPLSPDPTPPAPPTPGQAQTAVASANAARGLPSFLGQGLLRPFRRDQKSDFANDSGVELVVACVGQILGTRASSPSSPGELPWRTDFGSKLHLLRHANHSDVNEALASVYAQDAITAWEPRVASLAVTIEDTGDPRVLQVRIRFNVVDRGGRTILANQEATVPVATAA